ncbi:type I-E CRISPR-associated protein Cse1/CasA [uncultured Deinococcus sp.]|uniref:type I-E CRISPR-associated protein Cse1/CasA n=1 Tax=uncultured Deinococcus sp. TaxID=158789 RepID=UPI00374A6C5A
MNSPPTFNLLHEPWIPVRPVGGGPVREVCLRELLLCAREFGRIDDPSPLVTAALLRLSLALLHRALAGPRNAEETARWFLNGFPAEKLEAYFAEWEEGFDLFHPERPFWQKKTQPDRENRYHWSLLTPELNGSNTTPVFGTKKRAEASVAKSEIEATLAQWIGTTTAGQAVRLLIQNQSFALGGRVTGTAASQQGGPVMSKALFVPQGENLLQTLCLNLLTYSGEMAKMDRAVWEWQAEDMDRADFRQAPLGFADRYTWLSRGITLFPEPENPGMVAKVGYGAGISRVEDSNTGFSSDPMAALVSKKVEGSPTLLPLGLNLDRLAWRDLQAILPEPQDQLYTDAKGKTIQLPGQRPFVLQNAEKVLTEVSRQTGMDKSALVPVHVFGQILGGKPGITSAFRHEVYALPLQLVNDWDQGGKHIESALSGAKAVADGLRGATRKLAAEVLSRGGEREPHKDDLADLVQTLPGLGAYWAALEHPFRVLLADLDTPDTALADWRGTVTREARRAWGLNLQGVGAGGAVHGYAYRPRRVQGKLQLSPQATLEYALKALHAGTAPPPTPDSSPTQEATP